MKAYARQTRQTAFFNSAFGVLIPDGEKHVFTGITNGSVAESIARGRKSGYAPLHIHTKIN